MGKPEDAANLLIDWMLDHPDVDPIGGRGRALDVLNTLCSEIQDAEDGD